MSQEYASETVTWWVWFVNKIRPGHFVAPQRPNNVCQNRQMASTSCHQLIWFKIIAFQVILGRTMPKDGISNKQPHCGLIG